jgi:hypothetical protein
MERKLRKLKLIKENNEHWYNIIDQELTESRMLYGDRVAWVWPTKEVIIEFHENMDACDREWYTINDLETIIDMMKMVQREVDKSGMENDKKR